jgi:glutathione peroxidase
MNLKDKLAFALVIIGLNINISLLAPDIGAKCYAKKENPKEQTKNSGVKNMADIYQFKAKSLDGKDIDFSQYKGEVLLIVNTASKCGFTPQYAGLEELNKKYAARGLKILGFPCNQFGGQEPGDNNNIASFCEKNYGVDFQMFDKINVNGKDAHPLYKYLEDAAPGMLGTKDIKWNFTKFLVDRNGKVVERYASSVKPEDIASAIEKQL